MKKFVIIVLAVIITGLTAMGLLSKAATGHTTHVTTETTWFNSDHSKVVGTESNEYTIKTDNNGNSVKFKTGVLDTINK